MMVDWKYRVRKPPDELGEEFFRWLWEAQEDLSIVIACLEPTNAYELEDIQNLVGEEIPEEIATFYKYSCPWVEGPIGRRIWKSRIIANWRTLFRQKCPVKKPFWPVFVANNRSYAVAKSERGERPIVSICHHDDHHVVARTRGLWAFFVMCVVAEYESEEWTDFENTIDARFRNTAAAKFAFD